MPWEPGQQLQFMVVEVTLCLCYAQFQCVKVGGLLSCVHAGGPVKRNAELFFPAEFADDFPVSLQVSTAQRTTAQRTAAFDWRDTYACVCC
jgi:hypothetical protein